MRNNRRRRARKKPTARTSTTKVVRVSEEELRERVLVLEDKYPDIAMFADPDCGECCGTSAFADEYGWAKARDYEAWCTNMWMLGYDIKTLAPAD